MYRLAVRLDDVVDYMDAAVELTILYNPEALPDNVRLQVDVLDRCAKLTEAAMPRLATLRNLKDFWVEINELENEADQIYRRLLQFLMPASAGVPRASVSASGAAASCLQVLPPARSGPGPSAAAYSPEAAKPRSPKYDRRVSARRHRTASSGAAPRVTASSVDGRLLLL
jgi:hypothetical protein